MRAAIGNLQTGVAQLQKLISFHKHLGSDLTQKLDDPQTIFGGTIADTGTAISLPLGWFSSKSATGIYVVTHKLNTTNYVVTANPMNSTPINDACYGVMMTPYGANSFTIEFMVDTGTTVAINTAFNFVLLLI